MLAVAKQPSDYYGKKFRKKHIKQNIWRNNNQEITNNIPLNIL